MKKPWNKVVASIATIALLNPTSIYAMTKTETIYANLKQDGTVNTTSVNVGLKDLTKGDVIDYTNLEKIKNINGQEKFSKDSTRLTWKSTGKEIYYQDIINDSLPIEVNIKYFLNGKETTPKEMKDKSGTVRVELNYKNNSYNYSDDLYTPFVVTTVMMLPSDNNSNIQITNGKVVNTGVTNIVTAITAPGLYESTNIDELRNLDHITLSYETESFDLKDIYVVTTPKLLDKVDLDKLDEVSNLTSSFNTLQDGVDTLQNGSKQLQEGTNQITTGLEELNDGLENAFEGSKQITEGLGTLEEGTSSISSLTTLVNKLYETYNNNNQTLIGITSGETTQALTNGIENAIIEKQNLENQLITVKSQILQLEQLKEAEMITDEQFNLLQQLYGAQFQLEAGIEQYNQGIEEAQANLAKLPYASATIQGANAVIESVLTGVLGVPSTDYVNDETISIFNEKINQMVGGVQALHSASSELTSGLEQLHDGSSLLVDGSKQLSTGTDELYKGIEKLNNEGIHKLTEYGNIANNYSYKIKQLGTLSKNYHGFSSDNVDETIFIYKVSVK